jgi:hypothetical protein
LGFEIQERINPVRDEWSLCAGFFVALLGRKKGGIMRNKLHRSFSTIVLIALIAVLCLPEAARAGAIASWGSDSQGQVSNTPTESGFAAIAAGDCHSLALRADGSIVSWGLDNYGQVSNTPTGSGFIAIAAGYRHSLALRADGSIVSWGWNEQGQVSNTPTESGFTAIAAGNYHCLALTADGSIASWGSSIYAQVGDTPTESSFIAIAAGSCHSLALRADGSTVSWGRDHLGQVSNSPTESGFTAIASGGDHSLALRADGSIVSWGNNAYGMISDTPTETGFTAIGAGSYHSVARQTDGSIVSWGKDDFGQVSNTPIGSASTAIASGGGHSLALVASLLLLEPNGNERLTEGSHYEIKWAGGFLGNEVLIEYSGNNGADWHTITTVQDANSYDWQVPGPASKDCLVRVTDTDFPTVSDTSDNTFLIYTCDENLIGDFNQDCRVDLLDFAFIAQNWLTQSFRLIYYFPLDSTANWTTEGQWQFGQPTGNGGAGFGYPDPDSGYTGSNVYGVNLSGDYTNVVGGPYYLTAGPFDCNGFGDMKLRFARWLNTDSPPYVQSKVQVSNNGTSWDTVWENTAEVTDSSWQIVEYDVSEIADNQPTVYFRWSYEILDDRAYLCSGWNIDDIELLGRP